MPTTFRKNLAALALAALPLIVLAAPAKPDTAPPKPQPKPQPPKVFMPQNSLPVIGRNAVRTAYRQVFDAIKLNIRFEIDEIRPLSTDWAYARTRSNGTVKVLASGQAQAPEVNQELFILHRADDGRWRFARYIFSTTNPPAQH